MGGDGAGEGAEKEVGVKSGERVTWVSRIGKERAGKYVTRMVTRPGFALVLGDDGNQHTMRADKLRRSSKRPAESEAVSVDGGRWSATGAKSKPDRRVRTRNVTAYIESQHGRRYLISPGNRQVFPYAVLDYDQHTGEVFHTEVAA